MDDGTLRDRMLADLLPDGCERVLEIGCASRGLAAALKAKNGNVLYMGSEDPAFREGSGKSGPAFDCIVFGEAALASGDPDKALRAAAGWLGEGGSLVCCLPNVGHWSVLSALLEGRWPCGESPHAERAGTRFHSLRGFKDLLEKHGFLAVRELRLRTSEPVPEEIVPLLRKLHIDLQAFVDRAATSRFLLRAELAFSHVSAYRSSWNPAGPGSPKTVAIVIPVFNKVELTRDCLESIARHYPESTAPEVIVFDNASTDGTPAYLEEAQKNFDWLKVVRSRTNLGFARACNKGAELSGADILVFLNNDTVVLPMWLERMLDRIEDPTVGIVGSKLIYPDGSIQHAGMVLSPDGSPVHVHHQSRHRDPGVNRMKEYPAVTGACMMIKRCVFTEAGLLGTEYPMYYEDVDLCFKVREKGLKVIYQPESMVIHLEGRSSDSREAIVDHVRASKAIFNEKWGGFMRKERAADPDFYQGGRDYRPG